MLVAHNAPFDIGFLKAAASRSARPWPTFQVLCTVKLARRVLTRDEAPSVKLSALAHLFQVTTQPTHRALDDARATVDVLHGLIDRVGNQGVHSYSELVDYLPNVSAISGPNGPSPHTCPERPGVYLFRGPSDEVLYIGTATDLRRRVRNYFTGSETRGRMKEMVALATRVDHVECAHALEAGVRELRLLGAHAPPYNRRSKFPKRGWWITLTDEAFPTAVRGSHAHRRFDRPVHLPRRRSRSRRHRRRVLPPTHVHQTSRRGAVHGPDCPARELGGVPRLAGHRNSRGGLRGRPCRLRARFFRGTNDAPLQRMQARIDELAAARAVRECRASA